MESRRWILKTERGLPKRVVVSTLATHSAGTRSNCGEGGKPVQLEADPVLEQNQLTVRRECGSYACGWSLETWEARGASGRRARKSIMGTPLRANSVAGRGEAIQGGKGDATQWKVSCRRQRESGKEIAKREGTKGLGLRPAQACECESSAKHLRTQRGGRSKASNGSGNNRFSERARKESKSKNIALFLNPLPHFGRSL